MPLADEPQLPKAGDRIARYEVVAPVGRGGMAAVFAVRLPGIGGFGKILAMKVLLPHLKTQELLDMFLDEARIAAQIQHPNVAQLFELGEHEGMPFMVMELLRGRSYAQVIERASTRKADLPRSFHLRVLADAARGLHAAHEARDEAGNALAVVHRDVSPQNIHVGYDGQVKVVDFGIARARGRITQTESGTVKGKLRYLAPEQLDRRAPMDRRVDVWALGVMLWEVMSRDLLFRADDEATTIFNVLHKEVPRLRDRVPDVPRELDELAAACLSRDVERRPSTADQVARVLDAAARACHDEDEIARAQMEALFGAERDKSELHLSRAVRELESRAEAPATQTPTASTRAATVVSGGAKAPRNRTALIAAALMILLVAVGAAALGWNYGGEVQPPPAAAGPIERPADVVAEELPEPAAIAADPQAEPVAVPEPVVAEPAEPPRARAARRPRPRRTEEVRSTAVPSTPTAVREERRPLLESPY